jgi:DNA-binding MarR family transcriptional regulator
MFLGCDWTSKIERKEQHSENHAAILATTTLVYTNVIHYIPLVLMSVARESYCRCLYYSANALARKITRLAEEEFEPTGLAPSLGFVVMTANKKPGITAGELASTLQLQPSTVSRFVDKLEASGFLARQADGKFTNIYPTAKARQLDITLQSSWKNLFKRYTAVLGEQDSTALTSAIVAANNKLEET